MKIILFKNTLLDIISNIQQITPRQSDLSILNFFKLTAQNDDIFIYASDLEIFYVAKLSGKIEKEGELLIPAKQFYEIIQNFYEDTIELEEKENVLFIKGENSFSTLPTISKDEFINIPEFKKDEYIEINSDLLDDYLLRLYSNIKTAEIIKPEFSGVYFCLDNKYLRLVSTDTIRLSEVKIKRDLLIINTQEEKALLIPQKIILEYLRIKKKPVKTKIYLEPTQITFDLENQILISKLLTIEFPDYQQVIPKDFNIILLINREETLKALKLNKVFLNQAKELQIKLISKEGNIEFYTKNELMGESRNIIKAEYEKYEAENDITFTFNFDFFYEGIKNLDSEKIFLGLNIPDEINIKPALFKSPLEEDFIYILIPL
ncbi:MAG: DNA polymerase III subunit beta [Candidatus Aenigmatarchaeota archaeon]